MPVKKNIATSRIKKSKSTSSVKKVIKPQIKFVNRDISWLSFNERVLQEATDPTVPLMERMKFLAIFSSNGDEFFRVRVAALKRLTKLGAKAKKITGYNVEKLLDQIQQLVIKSQRKFIAAYDSILKELGQNNIRIIDHTELTPKLGIQVREYFNGKVLPTLAPLIVSNITKFPYLKDRTIYLFVTLIKNSQKFKSKHALIEVPTSLMSRFLVLDDKTKHVILLEDVIRYCLDDVFFYFDYDEIHSYTIKLTRDAELDIENDVSKSFVNRISESVKNRRKGTPTRLNYEEGIPPGELDFILRKIKFQKDDSVLPTGRHHNFFDFINFPNPGIASLRYPEIEPISHRSIPARSSILGAIRQKDILLTFPYQSYHYIIDLLRECSIDPKVTEIDITLYRVAKNSAIVNALSSAIKNGKKVTLVVELQARFDEENNIKASNRLLDDGARVIYGVPGLKAHSKLLLIKRTENSKPCLYAHLGTGNFNEDTAKIYCDYSLLTCDKGITAEVQSVFHFYANNYKTGNYKHLLVSPFFMRKKLIAFIGEETEKAKKGKPASIFLKMNSLNDEEMIAKLYEASCAGVKIRIIARSICSLIPGQKGMSENIEVRSIVDKYLEHARVFVFGAEDSKVYISSADFMIRNLDFRSEVAVPIYDKQIKQQLIDMLEIQWSDNVKARIIDPFQTNQYVNGSNSKRTKRIRAQVELFNYLKKIHG